jgi:hypothetical protein
VSLKKLPIGVKILLIFLFLPVVFVLLMVKASIVYDILEDE